MSRRILRCPLCGTALSAAKYTEVLRKHEDLKAHLQHLKDEAARLKQEKQMLRARYAEFRRRQAAQQKEALRKQKGRVERAALNRAQKEARALLRKERGQMRKEAQEFRKTRSRLTAYEKRMTALADRSRKQDEEIRRLKKQIEKGITPQIEGLLEEENLLKYLKTLFPGDDFERTRKLGDIVHTVLHRGKPAGLILYECKKVKAFSKTYVRQTSEARRERQADYAILVTNALPGKQKFFFVQRDVIVISPAGLEPVVHTARESLIRIHLLRASEAQKAKAVQAVYSYLAGAEYSTKVNNIAGEIVDLAKELQSELQFHKRNWTKRYNIYRSVFYDVGAIDEKLRRLLGAGSSDYAEKLEAGAPKLLPYPSIPDLEPASR